MKALSRQKRTSSKGHSGSANANASASVTESKGGSESAEIFVSYILVKERIIEKSAEYFYHSAFSPPIRGGKTF